VAEACAVLLAELPWLDCLLLKQRNAVDPEARRGVLLHGSRLARRVREDGVWYAVDLRLNRDASLYLDTRNLRRWLRQNLAGRSMLNTFAYTGSLGVAALAGGASRVVQLDRSREFLNLAKQSCALNGLGVRRADFVAEDFHVYVSRLRRSAQRFDCVVVDPPFFAVGGQGRVDLIRDSHRVLNKVRPLVEDGGWLIGINNALYLSGADYLRTLEELCQDGYLSIESLVPVPSDHAGPGPPPEGSWPADPAPFNHPTKIAVLRVRRKAAAG
jgi:23S rRNA (cytosine1962-C5)-methyltransferase